MDQKKKFCKKKRSIAKSMLSLILVFAMVISNVQTTSGMLSTVWAAESETETPDEQAGTSNLDESGEGVQASNTSEESKPNETGEKDGTGKTEQAMDTVDDEKDEENASDRESSGEKEKITEPGESEVPEGSTESGTTEENSELEDVTYTIETEEETTEEENKGVNGDNDNAKAVTETIRIHFSNTLDWDNVYLYYWGDDIIRPEWPGIEPDIILDGYYTFDIPITNLSGDFNYIFNNNNGSQTIDESITGLNNADGALYECWVWLTDSSKTEEGRYNAQLSLLELTGPEISSDGTQVTFRYKNPDATTVKLAGTMNGWVTEESTEDGLETEDESDANKPIIMEKGENGLFTYTMPMNDDGYEYKFVVDDKWIFDPCNPQVANGNSYVGKVSEKAVVKFHFKNTLDWESVRLHYWGSGITGTTWPGILVTEDKEGGYYTIDASIDVDALESDFQFLFTVGSDGPKTADGKIGKESLKSGKVYECWVWLTDSIKDSEGNVVPQISLLEPIGPQMGNYSPTVTFRYKNPAATTVKLAGDMNDWANDENEPEEVSNIIEMEKDGNGLFTYTATLEPGGYQYKLIVDGEWMLDPGNMQTEIDDKGNPNSYIYVGTYTTYTIYYYNQKIPNPVAGQSDLWIWPIGTNIDAVAYPLNEIEVDQDNENIIWQKTTVAVPYKTLGIIGRPTAGSWSGQDDDQTCQLDENKTNLWYIHGKGIYNEKPNFGEITKVTAELQNNTMDYTQNNVLTLTINDNEATNVFVDRAYVDASKLGMSEELAIDSELLAISLSVRIDTKPEKYELPITVIDFFGNTVNTTVEIEVVEKENETENDFDWDEAVIYFMVTDRFFDGNEGNNTANGTDGDYSTYGKDNPGLYHGGDFAGVTEKLEYLKELGVNTIWITPIVENVPGVTVKENSEVPYYAGYHGYWASDFEKLNPALGTEAEFKTLIDTAHEKGMKIMVDVVVNHAGYGMEDTEKFPGMIRDSKDVVEGDFILGDGQAGLPDFLTEIPEVRNKIIDWQVEWAKKGVDYFRVDTVKHVDSTTWMAFKNALTKENPNFKMIGEYYDAGYQWNNDTLGTGQMDSLLDFDFNEWATNFVDSKISSVENALTNRNKALNNTYLTGQFLSSHDEIGFKQNLIKNGKTQEEANAAALVAATLQITAKGQPVIYYGEEIGLTGDNDYPYQTNRYDFDWSKTENNSTLNHYKKMLAIRNEYAEVFARGDRQSVSSSNTDGYDVISRSYNGTTLYVGMNIKSQAQTITVNVNGAGITGYKDLYGDKTYEVTTDNTGNATIQLTIPAAADGGTVVLVADSFASGLIDPELTIVKGRETTLPAQLTRMSEDGSKTLVDVTYSMDTVEGVTLDVANKKITVAETFEGKTIELTAKAGDESITFQVKVVEDKNQITLRLHYNRSNKDNDYTGWNVWSWREGSEGKQYDFDSEDEDGGKVVTFELEGRSASVLNYIIRQKVGDNEWAQKDFPEDCYVDLSDILSGTVDYYVTSGDFPGKRVLGDDVLVGIKIRSVTYNSSKNVIKIITGTPITGDTDGIFTLKRSDGTEIAITGVRLSSADKNEYELSLGSDLSGMEEIVKKYILIYDGYEYDVTMPSMYSSDTFESQYTYQGDDLGATWSSNKTTFKVWAPTADKVQVNLYKSGTKGADDLIEKLDMTKGNKGVWSVVKAGDLNGTYYTYSVEVEGSVTEACDPYARTTGVNGDRAMVINLSATNPAGWSSDRGPNAGMSYTDSVIYELHVRDFSIDESSGIQNKGKFLGLTEKGTKNATGQTTGLDYLTDLGVTHIHLLPSYDYATVDETNLDTPQYNWGYDPKNYNVPEGSYSTDPYNGAVRVKEMKQMVKTLHDNNINVIMDVVYNHVYDADEFSFNQIVPKYFSRTNADGSYSNGSGCGNDTASERSMVRKYIVDSVNYWADEYHIDGFRFDLVGLLDADTINEVVDTVHETHPDVIFYGEGWTMNTAVSKDDVIMATQWTSDKTPKFAYFSDTIRNLLKGDTFSHQSTGFVSGATGREEDLAKCFTATADWCKSPTQTVNYASCHDNYSLMDKLAVSRPDASFEDRTRMNNLAAAIYMTSEGIPLIHAAEELLREKIDENGEPVENSYKSSDLVNSIKWSNLSKESYRSVRDYYKGLIAFRKNHAALRLTTAAEVKANVKYNWISNELVMFVINGKDSIADEVSDGIVVIFNANTEAKDVNLYNNYGVAEGEWKVCVNDQKAGTEAITTVSDGNVTVAPISAMVLVKGETIDTDSVYGDNEQKQIELQRKELQDLIAAYEKLQKGSYTDDSWAAFTAALEEARQVVQNPAAALAEITRAKDNLKSAYNALEVPEGVVDTEKLKVLVALYQEIREQGQGTYTDDSWAIFTNALKAAEQLLEKQDVTQPEVNESYSRLETAYNGLTLQKPNPDALKELIAEYEKLEKGNYTDDSWSVFTDALAAAKAVVAKPDATQEEILSAEQALRAAYDALKVIEGAVDKGKLKALVSRCNEIAAQGQGSYTAKSWKAFTDALAAAEKVLADEAATQENIDKAYDSLNTARNGLTDIEEPEVHEGLWTKWTDDSGLVYDGSDGKYHITYTGKAIKPAILVFDGETQLKEKTDYTISYKDNTNASTGEKEATVTIKGKGNYSESMERKFTIDQVDMDTLDIDDLCVLMKVSDNQVQGTVALKPVVKYNGKTLKANKDYEVTFVNEADGKTPGVYPVRVKALNPNFKNHKDIEITVADKASAVLMSKVKISKIDNRPYEWDSTEERGKVQTPEFTVSYGGENLTKDEDYTVKYDTVHTEAGQTATITVKGIKLPYVGEKKVSFKITGQALKANMVTVDDQVLEYTGEAQRPDVTVSLGTDAESYKQYAVEYQNNTNVGKATVIVSGINGYTGTVKKTFKITAYDIQKEGSLFTFGTNNVITDEIRYAKGGSKLTDENVNARFTTSTGSIQNLVQGRDYTLTYKNNTKVSSDNYTASATLKGKGNYKGTINISFTIKAQNLENLKDSITAEDILVKNAKKYNKVIPVITDTNGKKLKNKTDFVIDADTGYEVVTGSLDSSGNPEIGAEVKVTAKGIEGGNYEGSISTTFRVIDNNKNISKAVVKVKDQTYTGNAIVPGKGDIESTTLKIGRDTVELKPDDYEIIGCTNNVKKGTAKLTIHGLGEYGGTKTVKFKIVAQPMN